MNEKNAVSSSDLSQCEQRSWWTRWLGWLPTSNEKLAEAEHKIFERVSCHLDAFFVPVLNSLYYLHTIVARNYHVFSSSDSANENLDFRVPVVLLHGFASGCGLWCKNLDSLSRFRPVYAFDMLGFGRSSRPEFPLTAEEVEKKFIDVIESWRVQMHLEKFILVGHSMGGYLATSYSINYPERIVHLILADPWGFVGQSDEDQLNPSGVRGWFYKKLNSFRALSSLRFFGPLGPRVMRMVRQDFADIFFQQPASVVGKVSSSRERKLGSNLTPVPHPDAEETLSTATQNTEVDFQALSPFDPAVVYNYMYHINARHPSGEDAFLRMSKHRGWAARPMLNRITQMNSSVPISFSFGARSWIDSASGMCARDLLPQSYVDVMVIEGGGHHAYAQFADEFNSYVNAIASLVDEGHQFRPGSEDLVQAVAFEMLDEHQSPSSDSLVTMDDCSW